MLFDQSTELLEMLDESSDDDLSHEKTVINENLD